MLTAKQKLLLQISDPELCFKTLDELSQGLHSIADDIGSPLQLQKALGNLENVRIVLLGLYCTREILIKHYAYSVIPTSVSSTVEMSNHLLKL